MRLPSLRACLTLCVFGLVGTLSSSAFAQAKPGATVYEHSGIDIYAGYGVFQPLNSYVNGFQYHEINSPNVTGSLAYYIRDQYGLQVEGSYFQGNNNINNEYGTCPPALCNQRIYTAQAGPIFRFAVGPFMPFVHALGGGARFNGPASQPLTWGPGATLGAGFDYVLPFWNRHLAVRPMQIDYQYAHVNYGAAPAITPATTGGTANINAVKLSAGLVFHLREASEKVVPLIYGCSAQPLEVYAGEPVTVVGSIVGLKGKTIPQYSWAAKGGTLTSNGNTATVDTTGLEPGQYEVVGRISTGLKPGQQSYCSAPFTVKGYNPPTITCTGSATTAQAGDNLDVEATGRSEQNLPLTYSFTTSAGQLAIHDNKASVSTAGLPPGNITVDCMVKDSKNKTAHASVVFVITPPPPPPPNPVQELCSLHFARDQRRPARVDNEAKGCLDTIALAMNREATAKLVLVGDSRPDEKPEIAAERAINTRLYLTNEKALDPARISVRVGETSGPVVKSYLVPAGAKFDVKNTQRFDEKRIPHNGEAYGTHHKDVSYKDAPRKRGHRKGAEKK
jgi:hypothetical protein